MTSTVQKQILDLIKRTNNVLILPSSPPDGDSIGGAIALYMALKKLKKEVTIICKDPVPEVFHFLPNIKVIGDKMVSSTDFIITLDCRNAKIANIKNSVEDNKVNIIITPGQGRFSEEDVAFNKGAIKYDLIITVDCAELTQLGELYENNIELFHQIPVVNIDHHISNTHFGKVNYVDIMASSTTELIFSILEELAKEEQIDIIDEDIATLLLTGIITDTGSFQNANTTPRSFAKSAQLIAYGARQQEIIQNVYKTKQLTQLKLWGRILSKIQTDRKYRIVWATVSQQDFKDTESSEDQIGDIIDELMTNAPGAEIILLIKEKAKGEISASIRTTSPVVDASKIAEIFGGGGHIRAAGFRIKNMDLRDAEYKIINKIKESQAERLGLPQEEEQEFKEAPMNVEEVIRKAEQEQQAVTERSEAESIPVKKEKIIKHEEVAGQKNPKKEKLPKQQPSTPKKSQPTKFHLSTPSFEEAKKEEPEYNTPAGYRFED